MKPTNRSFRVEALTTAGLALALLTSTSSIGRALDAPTWKYYRVGNTGIQGDYHDALWIGPDGDPWIGGYDPGFEEGGIAKFIQSENRWENISNVDYPVIGHSNDTGTTRVSDIAADAQGNLWMGTGRGALKFTPATGPASLVRYTSSNSTLPGGWTTGVEVAPDGSIWFSAYGTGWGANGLARFEPGNGHWSSFGHYGDGSLAVQPKPSNGYFVWTKNPWNGNFARWDSATQLWTEFPIQTNQPWELVGKGCTDASGNTWMIRLTGNSYVFTTLDCRRPDGTWINPPVPSGVNNGDSIWAFRAWGNMQALLVDGNSTTWRFNGTSWTNLGTWRTGAYSYDVGIDAAGGVWVCGVGGAGKRNPVTGQWQRYRITNTGHFDDFTRDLTIDPDHNFVYAGANAGTGVGGMTRFDGQRWVGWNNSTYGLGYNWPFSNDNCQSMTYRPSNGRVAVSPYWGYGVHEWTGSGFNMLHPTNAAARMCEDSLGRLWNLGEYFNLSYYDGTWHQVPILAWGSLIKPDPWRAGTVWATTGYEILRTDGDYRFSRTIADFPELVDNSDQFGGIAVDANGIAWIGCTVNNYTGGLIRMDTNTGNYTMYRSDQGWPFPGTYVVPWQVTPDGRLWMVYDTPYPYTERGLLWWDGTNMGTWPAPPGGDPQWGGLPHGQVEDMELRVLPDHYELWMTCVSRGIAVLSVPTQDPAGVDPDIASSAFTLEQSAPNPFRTSTRLAFSNSRDTHVRLAVHDVSGQLVRTLVDGDMTAGRHEVAWDGKDAHDRALPGGVYFWKLDRTGGESLRQKTILLR